MSTTTKRLFIALPVVLVCWIALMAAVMRYSDAAPAAVVIFPGADLLERVPDPVQVMTYGRNTMTIANRAGLAADLYAAGALLVLPAGLTGCLPLTSAQKSALSAKTGVSE